MTPSANTTPGSTPPSGGFCAACGAPLSAGARFCHRCGTPVGQGAPGITPPNQGAASSNSNIIPWALAFVAVLVLVANFAGKNFGKAKGSEVGGSSNSIANPAIDGPAMAAQQGRAPDISQMTSSERASRLFNRVMEYAENNKMDSAMMFIPMAIPAHQAIENISNDERFHLARLGEIAKDTALMRAESDTILASEPNSLLGLMAGIRAAEINKNSAKVKQLHKKFLSVLDTELAKNPVDYQVHRSEIDMVTTEARKNN